MFFEQNGLRIAVRVRVALLELDSVDILGGIPDASRHVYGALNDSDTPLHLAVDRHVGDDPDDIAFAKDRPLVPPFLRINRILLERRIKL